MIRKSKLLIIFFLFLSCKTNKEFSAVNLRVKQSVNSIILRTNLKEKKASYIKIPLTLRIENNSNKEFSFKSIKYKYFKNPEESLSLKIFKNYNNKLIRYSNNFRKIIKSKSNLEYEIFTRHFIGKNQKNQKKLSGYINKMILINQDTLHIGTVADFKRKHKELFESLTKNDSISIQLLDNDKLGKRITVPVKWD